MLKWCRRWARSLSAGALAICLYSACRQGVAQAEDPALERRQPAQGLLEHAQFEKVRRNLPAPVQAVVTFLYLTGWRVDSEVLPLQWRQVDLAAGTVRLDPGTTKSGEGRNFPLTGIPERVAVAVSWRPRRSESAKPGSS